MLIKTPKGTVIKRTGDVGKKIGNFIYLHKDYINSAFNRGFIDSNLYNKFVGVLPQSFRFNILKISTTKNSISFINSPDFDISNEPYISDIYLFNYNGSDYSFKYIKERKTLQIYHHKWLFVMDDYKGFDVNESKIRSHTWLNKYTDINMYKIGNLKYWNEHTKNT